MAQERFADVVERFANGFGGAAAGPPSPERLKQWHEELERNVKRVSNLARLATAADPKVCYICCRYGRFHCCIR